MLEQHPVPQNVTSFQFKLVGDMTLKQFGYLAGGVVLALVSYNLPLPFFFKYPMVAVFVLGGIGFAFVPVQQRPMDVWFMSFVRSIYSPTQYIWQKDIRDTTQLQTAVKISSLSIPILSQLVDKILPIPGKSPSQHNQTTAVNQKQPAVTSQSTTTLKQQTVTQSVTKQKKLVLPHITFPKISFMKHTTNQAKVVPPVQQHKQPAYAPVVYPSVVTNAPLPSVSGNHVSLDQQKQQPQQTQPIQQSPAVPRHEVVIEPDPQSSQPSKEYQQLEKKLQELEKLLQEERQKKQDYQKIQQQLVDTLTDKQQLERQIQELKTKSIQQPAQPTQTREAVPLQQQASPTISVITPQVAKNVGIPRITSIPNVVSGVVRERNGNLLVGILVTVKDKEDIPVRALKTNKLGQFAASTPLPNGDYILETEDPKEQFVFDLAKVSLQGSVIPPIELIAKSKQDLDRNKLEQALFGATS